MRQLQARWKLKKVLVGMDYWFKSYEMQVNMLTQATEKIMINRWVEILWRFNVLVISRDSHCKSLHPCREYVSFYRLPRYVQCRIRWNTSYPWELVWNARKENIIGFEHFTYSHFLNWWGTACALRIGWTEKLTHLGLKKSFDFMLLQWLVPSHNLIVQTPAFQV